jgi:hypothetical protein
MPIRDAEIAFSGEDYFTRHWRGHFTLARAFWINLIAVNVAMSVAVVFIQFWNESAGMVGAITLFVSGFAIWLWGAVGAWRSANRYSSKPGARIWGHLACGLIALHFFSWLSQGTAFIGWTGT